MIVADFGGLDSDIFQSLIQSLSAMIKHNGAVMREILSDQPVTVESAHFLNRKYTDAAKRFD